VRPIRFALAGILTGAAAATACVFFRLGEPAAIEIGSYCFGVKPSSTSACQTVDGAFYLFPGLVFGVAFGAMLWRGRWLTLPGAAVYAAAATFANAAATFVCVSLQHPLDDLLPFDNPILDLAFGGAIAGAAGGGLLGMVEASLDRVVRMRLQIAIAAGLGLLTPVVIMADDPAGLYAFYMIWQGGYAAAIAVSLPDELNAPGHDRRGRDRVLR